MMSATTDNGCVKRLKNESVTFIQKHHYLKSMVEEKLQPSHGYGLEQ